MHAFFKFSYLENRSEPMLLKKTIEDGIWYSARLSSTFLSFNFNFNYIVFVFTLLDANNTPRRLFLYSEL